MTEAVYLVEGSRTPIGSFMGSLSSLSAPELGAVALRGVLDKTALDPASVEEVYMGCVVTAGMGQAPARQAMLKAGLPTSTGAVTIGKVCGSGMKSLMLARASILAGDNNLLIAGGMESMSQTPHLLRGLRKGRKMGHDKLEDAMIVDGLWDPYNNLHMGNCAERCVEKYHLTREQQDNYAIASYERALKSLAENTFQAEITPVSFSQKRGAPVLMSEDEGPKRFDASKLQQLEPAFETGGTITAGNASTINDGAAAVLLASESAVKQFGLSPMARIVAAATHSQDPMWFTTAPIGAIQKVLDRAQLRAEQIDLFEINEAFAVVVLAAMHDLKLDHAKVNIRGGGISLGHPIGATGARLVVTLMHALKQLQKRYGLATLCLGGGEATALLIENLHRS